MVGANRKIVVWTAFLSQLRQQSTSVHSSEQTRVVALWLSEPSAEVQSRWPDEPRNLSLDATRRAQQPCLFLRN